MVGSKAYLMAGRETQDVDIYDPATGQWSKGATAPIKLHHTQVHNLVFEKYYSLSLHQ